VRNDQIAQKVTLGALPSVEAVDNQRSVLERKRQLILARRAFEKASIDLSLFLRDDGGRPRLLSQPAARELPEPAPLPASPDDAIGRALSQRPELRQLEAQLSVSSVERELAQNRVLPRLDGFAEVSRDFGRAPRDIEYTLAPTVLEVGVAVSVPLYLRKARGKLRAADAKLEASREKIRFARDKVRADVLDAWSQWRAAEERVALSRQSAEAAEKVASGERERFELGATSVLFVNLREQTATDAQISLIDAQAEVAYAAARAQLATGEALEP
jgi:outer membrane protein TolC